MRYFVIFVVCGLACVAFAQEMVTDRPDQTESAEVVNRGSVQLEMGIFHDQVTSDFEADSYGEILARIGVGSNFELRLGFDGYTNVQSSVNGHSISDSGMADTSVGFKWKMAEENGAAPQIALLMNTSLATGEDGFSSEKSEPAFRFNFSHTLTETIGLAYNIGMAGVVEEGVDGDDHLLGVAQYTLSLGIGINDKWGAFIESFGDVPTSASGGPANGLDGGFTYLFTPTIQWDLFVGSGISDAASDWFAGTGLTIRIDR